MKKLIIVLKNKLKLISNMSIMFVKDESCFRKKWLSLSKKQMNRHFYTSKK